MPASPKHYLRGMWTTGEQEHSQKMMPHQPIFAGPDRFGPVLEEGKVNLRTTNDVGVPSSCACWRSSIQPQDAVSGMAGPHSDRLTGRDNKDELMYEKERSIKLNQFGLANGAPGQTKIGINSTGECLPGTATTRFGYCAVTSGRAVNEPWVRSANMATVSYGNATASYVPRKGCKPSYSEFAVLADERSLMLSRPSFYSDPTPNELDSSVDGGLTRSLDTGGWR
ncbi:hypothetical protein pipiens_003905 [Culex pipiens pipiens]|uniref:Uncharacterized protein n=1 Tax=Culex pipiens pipiens TaxID=38569 RepID=A0ABD1CQZ2_CULPP